MERRFLAKSTKANVELDEVQSVEVPLYSKIVIESALIKSNPESIEEPLRRSVRVPYQSDRYFGFLVYDGNPIELNENDKDPITYMDAL